MIKIVKKNRLKETTADFLEKSMNRKLFNKSNTGCAGFS